MAPEDAVEAAVKDAELGAGPSRGSTPDLPRRRAGGCHGRPGRLRKVPQPPCRPSSVAGNRSERPGCGPLGGGGPRPYRAGRHSVRNAGEVPHRRQPWSHFSRRGEVVVCDEASMVATRELAALAVLVSKADGKLVLIGDHLQMGAVEAGGLFRLLVADAKTAELTAIRRFRAPWEADASRRLRDRDASVITEYEAHGRVCAGTRAEALHAAHQAWAEARTKGRSVVVMAADHATVDELAMRARRARVAAGEVEEDGTVVGKQFVGVGDEVVTTRNDRRLVTNAGAWVRNGDRWRVIERRPDGSLFVGSVDGRGKVGIHSDYVRDNVALAHAVTVHKAQGLTTDEAVLIVDEATSAEHLYVGLTRGRGRNLACMVSEPVDDGHRRLPAPSAADVLTTEGVARANRRGFSNGVCVGKSPAAVPGHYRGLRGLTQMPTSEPCTSACIVRQASENLATHRGRRAYEQTGLEILASLGVLARWIDEARVEEA